MVNRVSSLIAVAICSVLMLGGCAQQPKEVFSATLPFKLETARFGEGVANDGTNIYVFGGIDYSDFLNTAEVFSKGKWSWIRNIPKQMRDLPIWYVQVIQIGCISYLRK